MNDNYCDDLQQGSDETLTSACSHLHVKFKCFTESDEDAKVIHSSRVNDGRWEIQI